MGAIKEFCGVIGIYGYQEAAEMVYLGLYSLQHRGQEAAGIVSSDRKRVYEHRGQGHVVASETCAMDLIGAGYIRDVKPGELLCPIPAIRPHWDMQKAVPEKEGGYCTACFDGSYPVPLQEGFRKNQYEETT